MKAHFASRSRTRAFQSEIEEALQRVAAPVKHRACAHLRSYPTLRAVLFASIQECISAMMPDHDAFLACGTCLAFCAGNSQLGMPNWCLFYLIHGRCASEAAIVAFICMPVFSQGTIPVGQCCKCMSVHYLAQLQPSSAWGF